MDHNATPNTPSDNSSHNDSNALRQPLLQFLKEIRDMQRQQDYNRRPAFQRPDGKVSYPLIIRNHSPR